jgi:hypothetical protein
VGKFGIWGTWFAVGDSVEGFAMDAMAKFISDHNVEKFVDQLRWQLDPSVRTALQRLLLEEERRLGFNFEQLSMVNRQLSAAKERITAQKRLIERLGIKGHDTASAECLLNNLLGIERIFKQYRQVILDSINRNGL